jgi:hypothetical protein
VTLATPAIVQPVAPATSVPRGQALTPEQIAAYVQKQKELIQQTQVTTQPTAAPIAQPAPIQPNSTTSQRPTAITIPVRDDSNAQ